MIIVLTFVLIQCVENFTQWCTLGNCWSTWELALINTQQVCMSIEIMKSCTLYTSSEYNLLYFLFFKLAYLFVFLAALGLCGCKQALSRCGKPGLLSNCEAWASQKVTSLLQITGSRGLTQQFWWMGLVAPKHVKSSRAGLKPVSPVLAGRFFTTGPQGKSHKLLYWFSTLCPPSETLQWPFGKLWL